MKIDELREKAGGDEAPAKPRRKAAKEATRRREEQCGTVDENEAPLAPGSLPPRYRLGAAPRTMRSAFVVRSASPRRPPEMDSPAWNPRGQRPNRPPSRRQACPGHGLVRSISCSGRPHSWSPGRRAESCKCSVASPRTGTTSRGLTAGVQPSSKAVVRPRFVLREGPQPRRVPLRAKEPRFGPDTRQRPRRIFPCRGGSGRRPWRDVRPGP
jgi:hypothetical protein